MLAFNQSSMEQKYQTVFLKHFNTLNYLLRMQLFKPDAIDLHSIFCIQKP